MPILSPILRSLEGDWADANGAVLFWCPGCDDPHQVLTRGDHPWGYNGDPAKPTFTPSILVTYNGADADQPGRPPAHCHSYVTDGCIRFLDDCSHDKRGQTMDLPVWDGKWGGT